MNWAFGIENLKSLGYKTSKIQGHPRLALDGFGTLLLTSKTLKLTSITCHGKLKKLFTSPKVNTGI